MSFRTSGRMAAWLALAALVLNSLWPFAVDAKPPGIPQEICSVNVSQYANKGYGPAKLPPGEHQQRHCALCLPSSTHGALAAPPSFPWLARLPKATVGGLAAEPSPPQRVFLHPQAQPRAPPPYA